MPDAADGPDVSRRSSRSRELVPAVALLAASFTILAAACATNTGDGRTSGTAPGDRPSTSATEGRVPSILEGRPNGFQHQQRTFVDTTRQTPAGRSVGQGVPPSQRPSRTLVTDIYHPDAAGPRPLIMFAHGLSGHPDRFTGLLQTWAEAGYVVVAPAFPLTNATVPNSGANAFDLWDQPRDISFVLDQVLSANTTPGDELAGRIDPNRIGAAGLSLGGATTYALNFNKCCTDSRFIAVEVLSGAMLPMPQEYSFDRHIPLLIVHGDKDASLPYAEARKAFAMAQPPTYLVTLLGGTHAPPFEDSPSPHDDLAGRLTTDFWDTYLAGENDQLAKFEHEAVVAGLSSLDKRDR